MTNLLIFLICLQRANRCLPSCLLPHFTPSGHHPRHRYLWQGWRYTFNTRNCGFVEVWSMLLHAFSHQWTRIGEGYKLSPTRNYTTFHALTGLAHSSRAKYRYNESLLEIINLTVKIQKLAQPIIKLRNITIFAYYMIC